MQLSDHPSTTRGPSDPLTDSYLAFRQPEQSGRRSTGQPVLQTKASWTQAPRPGTAADGDFTANARQDATRPRNDTNRRAHRAGTRGLAPRASRERAEFADQLKELRKINFGDYLEKILQVSRPSAAEMKNIHAHHILFKLGRAQDRHLVAEGFEILIENGIDPIKGAANLVWAPNVNGQHTRAPLGLVVETLRKANAKPTAAAREAAVLDALKSLADRAAAL